MKETPPEGGVFASDTHDAAPDHVMSKRRILPWLGLTALIVAGIVVYSIHEGNTVRVARFDLDRNIVDTARKTGLRHFDVTNDFGWIEYDAADVPKHAVLKFDRPGLEIVWPSPFAFTLGTDHNRDKDDHVRVAVLQLSNRLLQSPAQARAFVEDTLAQFARGKWQRFIPEGCPRVTGRSSFLDASGAVDEIGVCPIDPAYRIPSESFVALLAQPRRWMWHSGDVRAEFTLDHMTIIDHEVYTGSLEFQTDEYNRVADASMAERDLRSPAERIADEKRERKSLDALEAAAVRRGDRVLAR
jgi:hypothetical protein